MNASIIIQIGILTLFHGLGICSPPAAPLWRFVQSNPTMWHLEHIFKIYVQQMSLRGWRGLEMTEP